MKRFSYVLLVVFLVVFFCPGNVLAADSQITIKEIKGLVQVQKAGEADWGKAQEFSTVTSGDKIRSFLESSALLAFPDGSEFYLRENTSLDIKDISQSSFGQSAKRELKLNLGSLHYKVPPKKEKATEFKVYSSTSIVGITGTEGIITSRGGKKPSENILIEGSTYNTNDQGLDGRYQTKGNVYTHDGKKAEVFSAQVDEEAAARLQISEEHMASIKEAVAVCKKKKDEGYKVIEAGAMLDNAFFYLENRQYDMAEQMIQKSNALLEKAKKIVLPEDLDGKIKNMIAQIKTKEDEGYDVAKAYSLAGKIQDLKQLGHFNEIRQVMTQVEKELAVLGEEGGSVKTGKTFVTYCEDVQKDILEKEQQGFVLNEIKSTLRQSQV
ncbi:MAG: FecR domain-containing protein, partial [Candidatus Omnitrophica bacterium]|nr:FecR domain-containing protein [Candidatus Omnitrophota bacterium]